MIERPARWPARHFDGGTPEPRNVEVALEGGALILTGTTGDQRRWPIESVVVVNEGARGAPVQLELQGERTEAVIVTGGGFLEALRSAAGPRRLRKLSGSPAALRVVLALTLAAALVLFTAWRWVVPALADLAARRIPIAWERRLGAAAIQDLAPERDRVDDPAVMRPVERAFTRLRAAASGERGSSRVYVTRSPVANAYAVPGGDVVVTTALLRALDEPDELSAVLAHEMTHVTERHSMRGLLRQEGLRLAFGLLSGDNSAFGALVGTAGTLGQLSYSRDDEMAADEGAARLLAAIGISPLALARVHDRLAALDSRSGAPGLEFLSTHPASAEREKRAREIAQELTVAPAPAPPDTASWRSMDEALAGIPDIVDKP